MNICTFFLKIKRERGLPIFDVDAEMNRLARKCWGNEWESEVKISLFICKDYHPLFEVRDLGSQVVCRLHLLIIVPLKPRFQSLFGQILMLESFVNWLAKGHGFFWVLWFLLLYLNHLNISKNEHHELFAVIFWNVIPHSPNRLWNMI